MLILRGPEQAPRIADPGIRQLVEERFAQICNGEAYDYDLHGYMIVVEPVTACPPSRRRAGVPSCVISGTKQGLAIPTSLPQLKL